MPDTPTPEPSATSRPALLFGLLCAVVVAGVVGYALYARRGSVAANPGSGAAAAATVDPARIAEVRSAPHLIFRVTALGPSYGRVGIVPLGDPGRAARHHQPGLRSRARERQGRHVPAGRARRVHDLQGDRLRLGIQRAPGVQARRRAEPHPRRAVGAARGVDGLRQRRLVCGRELLDPDHGLRPARERGGRRPRELHRDSATASPSSSRTSTSGA